MFDHLDSITRRLGHWCSTFEPDDLSPAEAAELDAVLQAIEEEAAEARRRFERALRHA